jgi:hypothetical protein
MKNGQVDELACYHEQIIGGKQKRFMQLDNAKFPAPVPG